MGIQEKIPKTDGLTAISIYVLGVLGLIFIALLEYACLLYQIKFRKGKIGPKDGSKEAWKEQENKIDGKKIDHLAFVSYWLLLISLHVLYVVVFILF